MVINIGALKSGDEALVLRDIRAVVEACKDGRALSKVIFETALLTDEEKIRACELSMKAGADYVKTSTGFAQRRRHGRGHRPDGEDGGAEEARREGLGRHPHLRRCGADDRGGGDAIADDGASATA